MDSLDSQMRHVERVNLCRWLMVVRMCGDHTTSSASKVGCLHVSRQLSLPFVSTDLKPDFDLESKKFLSG